MAGADDGAGEASERAGRRGGSPVAEEGENVGAALRGPSRSVRRRGGRGRTGGARGRVGEASGWLRPHERWSVATAPFGRGRERGQSGIGTEGGTRESGRGSRGPHGVTGASRRNQAGWEGGGGRGAWPRAPGACPSSWKRRKATGGVAVAGWAAGGAGPRKWAPGKWLGFSLFFIFLFCFLFNCH